MDYSSARGHTPLLDVQPPPHHHQRAEQPLPDYSLHHHQQTDQHSLHESCPMDYIDEHHQYKHQHHHHYHHHQRIQQFPLQHHHSPVVGGYIDLGGGCIAAEASHCDSLPHIEREKHGLPQNHYANQYSSAIVQASYRPYEDGFVSVKTHEEAHLPPKACEDAYVHPGRHENLHFAHDGKYSQHPLHSSPSASALIVPRIRFLCSIGGRIMGRPFDGKLRYCGGDTHVITVERGICFSEFIGKLSRMYGSAFTLKYQLPGEDLDALVSVTSDDDLQNMLDEYDKMLSSEASSWFRLFIFRGSFDWEIYPHHEFGHGRDSCTQMLQRYINAINGFDIKGGSECPFTIHVDNISNELQSSSRMASDFSYTTLSLPCSPPKAFSRYASAPSSIPSSPTVAARLAHCKQCGNGDVCFQMSKDQPGYVPPMNDIDVNSQEMSQDCHVESLKRDHHQSHIAGESLRIHQDPSFSRVDAPWMKENGVNFVDTEDIRLHQHECHRSTATLLVDSLHDVSKPLESRCETNFRYCPGIQPLTSPICHGGQVEDDFGRFEPMQHCYMEGHKQAPLGHQLQLEGLARVRQGPGIGPTCQTIVDGHGHSQFFQEPVHVRLPHVNVRSLIPSKALASAPSSPQNVYNKRCCCCQQHFQVDRGISVSLGENSHRKKPSYLGDRILKQHVLSRFCDGTNFCSDSVALHCFPRLETGLDFDEDELSKKHTLCKINTRHLVNCGAKENVAHSFMEPVHVLHEGNQCLSCYADSHDVKGQNLDKARDHSNSEFQNYAGHFDIHPGKSEDHLTAGRPILDLKADPTLDRGNDTVICLDYSNGHGDLETRTSCMIKDGREAAGYVHMQAPNDSSVFGQREFDSGSKLESFSSTAAVAGSLSRHSLERLGWVDSPPVVYHDQLKVWEFQECIPPIDLMASTRQMVDGTVNHGNAGDTCRRASFDCLDPYARLRSSCTPANATELRVEDSPVSSLTHVQEDKSSISNAHKSTPNFDNGCFVSSSQPFALRTLDIDSFKGSATLALPMYDQSPISGVNNATFSFSARPSELKNVSLEKEASEQCFKNRSALISAPLQSYGQHQEMAKPEVDSASRKTTGQEIAPVLEDSRALSRHSSRPCSADSGVHEIRNAPSETVSKAQNRGTSGSAQEANVSAAVHYCPEEDERELPATQAEAEAIARGLQIIKNDDLEDLKELGSGTYGTVFHGKWRGSDVAIKRIKASCFVGSPMEQERLISDFWREAGTLSQLHHPNIVAFYGIVPDGPEGTLATVTEYMVNGSLKQVLLKKDRTIDRRKRLLIAMDAAFGMEYLHSKRIVHFDLKSENLLVNMRDAHRPICKVGDFGLSKVKRQTLVSGGVRGTLPWMAPELLNTKGLVTEKVDVYSFGIVMWELLTGEEPYANMHFGTIIGGIVNDNLRPVIPSWCDPSWKELMERCWSGNPADRPDFSTVASELRAIGSLMNVK